MYNHKRDTQSMPPPATQYVVYQPPTQPQYVYQHAIQHSIQQPMRQVQYDDQYQNRSVYTPPKYSSYYLSSQYTPNIVSYAVLC
jgi:hypothetical protein